MVERVQVEVGAKPGVQGYVTAPGSDPYPIPGLRREQNDRSGAASASTLMTRIAAQNGGDARLSSPGLITLREMAHRPGGS